MCNYICITYIIYLSISFIRIFYSYVHVFHLHYYVFFHFASIWFVPSYFIMCIKIFFSLRSVLSCIKINLFYHTLKICQYFKIFKILVIPITSSMIRIIYCIFHLIWSSPLWFESHYPLIWIRRSHKDKFVPFIQITTNLTRIKPQMLLFYFNHTIFDSNQTLQIPYFFEKKECKPHSFISIIDFLLAIQQHSFTLFISNHYNTFSFIKPYIYCPFSYIISFPTFIQPTSSHFKLNLSLIS